MRALPLLPVVLVGCSGVFAPHDGTYLLTSELNADSCYPENPSIGQKSTALVSLYRTSDGGLALDLGGSILTGEAAKNSEFELSWAQSTSYSYDGCDRYESGGSVTVEGTFQADLGFDGTATSTERTVSEGCPDDEEETCSYRYAITAVKLDAARGRRPTGSIAWGYFGGSGSY
jgi:hypothetical protein